ncbi:MAG: heavy-metal-associated domain-containing protein [Planctomycetes bacterium]|nr:heavy-metal-associated domain-containing protein [Planctomycetota bacterium]
MNVQRGRSVPGCWNLRAQGSVVLWIAAAAALAAASFPYYAPLLLSSRPRVEKAAAGPTRVLTLRIDGMTCEACALQLERKPAGIPGVQRVVVSFQDGRAVLTLDAKRPPAPSPIMKAVAEAGFEARESP